MKKFLLLTFMMMWFYSINSFAALVAYYPFNGNALDESGHDRHGQLFNISLATDRFGNKRQAYRFDGLGYIKVENHFEELAEGITISIWVYSTQRKTALLVHTPGIGLLADEDNSLWFFSVQAVNAITQNEWQHFVATIDAFGNVDLYKNGEFLKGGSSTLTEAVEAQMTLGGAFIGLLDDIRVYNHVLSEVQVVKLYHEEKPQNMSTPQKKREGSYEEGYKDGRNACISAPQSCGLSYPSENHQKSKESMEENYQLGPSGFNEETVYSSNDSLSSLSSPNVILSIPLAVIEDNSAIMTELVRDVDTLTGDVIFQLKTIPDSAPLTEPLLWDIKINPTNAQKGDAQLVSWQSRHQAGYSFYLYDMNGQPVKTDTFLSETCQAIGSNGNDGCLGWQNSPKRRSDSWNIPAQLASGRYKIKVVIQSANAQLSMEKYSLPFMVK